MNSNVQDARLLNRHTIIAVTLSRSLARQQQAHKNLALLRRFKTTLISNNPSITQQLNVVLTGGDVTGFQAINELVSDIIETADTMALDEFIDSASHIHKQSLPTRRPQKGTVT